VSRNSTGPESAKRGKKEGPDPTRPGKRKGEGETCSPLASKGKSETETSIDPPKGELSLLHATNRTRGERKERVMSFVPGEERKRGGKGGDLYSPFCRVTCPKKKEKKERKAAVI